MRTDMARAAADLSDVVAGFRQRVGASGSTGVTLALPARTDIFVEFYFATPYRACGVAVPSTVVVGPATAHHTDIEIGGTIDTFTIKFQPTALHRLFGIPGAMLVDRAQEAQAVDARFRDLRQRLERSSDFRDRIGIAEEWLRAQRPFVRDATALDRAARLIRRSGGQIGLDRLADGCGLAPRDFRRRFTESVGLSPKLYGRIVRFTAALDQKARDPDRSWTAIAQQTGYFDQSHMLRDFTAFADGIRIPGRRNAGT